MTPDEARSLLEGLYTAWYPALVAHCRRLLGDHARAEDCAQHSLFELYRALRDGKTVTSPRAWTLTVARRAAFEDHRHSLLLDRIDEGLEWVTETDLPSLRLQEEFEQMLAVLTPREEAVLLLRLESLKYREIAEKLSVSVSAVNTLLARALEKIEALRSRPDGGTPARKERKQVGRPPQTPQ